MLGDRRQLAAVGWFCFAVAVLVLPLARAFPIPSTNAVVRAKAASLRLAAKKPILVEEGLSTSDECFHEGSRLYQECFALSTEKGGATRANLLKQAAALFRKAIELEESTLQNDQQHTPDNLLVALRALATVYASQKDVVECRQAIDEIRYWKSCKMPLPIEEQPRHPSDMDDYTHSGGWEWIRSQTKQKVALRTLGQPLLNASALQTIQSAAQRHRESQQPTLGQIQQQQQQRTRFTMQYAGNSDLHVADLVAHEDPSSTGKLWGVLQELLQAQVYPLVRRAFLSGNGLPLCVYDALIVRYDGNEATKQGRTRGASLPLHRDGGLFSVNIALQNEEQGGGGTLFDRLLLDQPQHTNHTNAILRPLAPGHAIVHRSTERHAGAPTRSGVREILVLFLTLRPHRQQEQRRDHTGLDLTTFDLEAAIERSFYWKELAQKPQLPMDDATIQRLYCWSAQENPFDGEALFWVARSQVQKAKQEMERLQTVGGGAASGDWAAARDAIWKDLQSGIASLEEVTHELDPCNVRTIAFLASTYSVRWGFALQTHPQAFWLEEEEELEKAATVLRKAIDLENVFRDTFGNEDGSALASKATLLIQLGEILFRQGQFQSALQFLGEVPHATKHLLDKSLKQEFRAVAKEMLKECRERL